MPKILEVFTSGKTCKKLQKLGIFEQHQKAANHIVNGRFSSVRLKKRKPYSLGIYYFRINKQYRALCYIEKSILHVFEIDDHQNS